MRIGQRRSLLALSLAGLFAIGAWAGASRADAAVYWGSGGFVGAVNLDGSNFVDGVPYGLANVPEIGNICGVAVRDGYLYWADDSRGTIGRMGLGTSPTGYVDFPYESVPIDEAFVSGLTSPWGVAVDGSHLYWASRAGMAIGRANLDGSSPDRTFISGVSTPCGVAVDGSHVYWGSVFGDSIGRASLSGGEVDEGFIEGVEGACGIAVDGAHVYWANWLGSSLGRANLNGGAVEHDFIGGLANPCGVAVDGSHVFWTNWNARDPVGRANLDGSGVVNPLVTTEFYSASCGTAVDSRSFTAPPQPPSAPIFLGRLRRSAKGAVAYIPLKVPAAGGGTVAVVSKGLNWKLLGPPPRDGGYLVWQLKLWPRTGRAAKRIRADLARKGRAELVLAVAYQEAGKQPYRATRRITLIRQRVLSGA